MDSSAFAKYMRGELPLDQNSLTEFEELVGRYPYFQTARILHLKNIQQTIPDSYAQVLQTVAIYASSRESLFRFLEAKKYQWACLFDEAVEPEKEMGSGEKDRTISLIDLFLSRYGDAKTDQQELPVFTPVVDYSAMLRQTDTEIPESPANNLRHIDLIDSFIQKTEDHEPVFRINDAEPVSSVDNERSRESAANGDEAFLTESLAKIYIKQKRYAKALEIIKKLSLKYPEKNIYFADQIRFLEKLIINIKN